MRNGTESAAADASDAPGADVVDDFGDLDAGTDGAPGAERAGARRSLDPTASPGAERAGARRSLDPTASPEAEEAPEREVGEPVVEGDG